MVLYPLHPATKARPIPVFPAVPSTIIPGYPGTSFPYSSAYFISHKAALSLTLPLFKKYIYYFKNNNHFIDIKFNL